MQRENSVKVEARLNQLEIEMKDSTEQAMIDLEYCIARYGRQDSFTLAAYDALDAMKKMQARIAELEKDAERLRFAFSTEKHGSMAIYELHERMLFGDEPSMDDVLKAIDTAMKGA